MLISIRNGSNTDSWHIFNDETNTSINIKDIKEKTTYLPEYQSNISNTSFKAKNIETVEDTAFFLDIINKMPKNSEIYMFEDQFEWGYSGFVFAGEGEKEKNNIFNSLPCSETLARRIFASIILKINEEEKLNKIFYLRPKTYHSFILYDSNNNVIVEHIDYHKLFNYIEQRKGEKTI